MATGKQSLLLFFVALIAGAYITYSAFHVPLSRGRLHGRRVLLEVREKIRLRPTHTVIEPRHTYSKRILGAQIQVGESGSVDDYGPPGSNPPYHEDPPTPFTMKSVHELTSFKTRNLLTDYRPIGPDPTSPDYPPLTIDNFRTDYHPIGPNPSSPDYPPDNFRTDYHPIGPNPTSPDYPPDNFRTDYHPIGPDPTPDNHDYPPPATMNFHRGNAV